MVTFEPAELVARAGGLDTYVVRWSSDLAEPEYTIYLNGQLVVLSTDQEEYTFSVSEGSQFALDVVDDGSAPEPFYTGVVTLHWTASDGASDYVVSVSPHAAEDELAVIVDDGRGAFEFSTEALADGASESYRVLARSAGGIVSVPFDVTVAMSRNPDVPVWAGSYDAGSGELTIAAG